MKNENDDLDVDDITENLNKPKRIKTGKKGKKGELDIVNDLNLRFVELLTKNPTWGGFSRTIGSGNRWGQQVNLPQHAKDTFTGDLVTPTNFKFVIESKKGYNDIDLFDCFSGRNRGLDEFLKQVNDDSVRSGKKPMLIWRKDRKEKLVFLKQNNFGDEELSGLHTYSSATLFYKEWIGLIFSGLLLKPDDFFFEL